VGSKTVLFFGLKSIFDQLLARAHFAITGMFVGQAKKQIAGKFDLVAQLAAENIVDGNIKELPNNIETGKFESGMYLSSVIVQAGGWVTDFKSQCFLFKWIVTKEIGF
jgi:hypothetical protein